MTAYVKRARIEEERVEAAVYRHGQPLDDLLAVARKADPDASVVEVPEFGVALVRHLEIPDHSPMYTDYDVLEYGKVLVWSERSYILYVTDETSFGREYERLP